jgi:hypothetical protein
MTRLFALGTEVAGVSVPLQFVPYAFLVIAA